MKQEKYDFINYGFRCAKERVENLNKIAGEIEEIYGSDARMEFEVGIAYLIDMRSKSKIEPVTKKEIKNVRTKLGQSNEVNYSYLAGNILKKHK